MAFVVPQHLPRAGYTQGSGFGSETSHAEPVLRKLAEATPDTLTAAEASKWADELQQSIDDTKTRVHQRIQKDLPAFERQLDSAKQIQTGLEELTLVADDLTDRVQSPQSGLLPTILTRLATHSALAQKSSDAKTLHDAVNYLAQCRGEFKALSSMVADGHLPAAVRKTEEAQSLIQSAPRPLERSAIMKDLSRLARVLGDRVQEQLGDAYARAIVITPFPTGATVVVLPHVTIRDSNGVVTLSELFTSLTAPSLQQHLSTLRKDILSKALEPILTKPSRLVTSTHESTLTIEHAPPSDPTPPNSTQQAHDALLHTATLVTFLHDTLFPSLPPQQANFAAQLAGPLSQALITHVLRPAVPRSGSLKDVPDFLRIATHAAEVEETLFKMGLRSGDVREWAQAAPAHYERRRREDLVQHVRGVVMERDGSAVAIKRAIVRSKEEDAAGEDDPWAFEQPASPPPPQPQVPIIATPIPAQRKASQPTVVPYVLGEPPKAKSPPPKAKSPPPEEEVDNWGFDEDEPEPAEPAKEPAGTQKSESGAEDTSEDEPDVEVYAGTSQSEGAGTSQSEGGGTSRSGNMSHATELLSAPQSDAEVVNVGQESEESDPWDDDPWADQDEAEAEKEAKAPVSPSKSPAPTLSPTKAPEPPAPPKIEPAPPAPPAVVEIPPSPAVHAPAPRVARGLERFAQKSRASPSPTPSKFNSPIVSNSSPTTISSASAFGTAPTSAFGTAPTSAIPHSATYAHSNASNSSPPKPHAVLPNQHASPSKSFVPPPAPPPFVSSKPPTIAPPITPAMRRAQQQAKLAAAANGGRPTSPFGGSQFGGSQFGGSQSVFGASETGSVAGSPGKRRDTLQREDRGSIGSISGGLFGFGGSQQGHTREGSGSVSGQSVFGSPERRVASVSALPPAPPPPVLAKEEPATETYLVSKKAQKVLALAEEGLKEGKALVLSDIFPPGTTPAPGSLVLGCIPSFFDLFRALVPVTHGAPMAASSGIAMRFSNDCIFLSEEIARLIADVPEGPVGDGARPKFEEVQERLKALGESWFEDVLDNEKQAIAKYLEPTEGFGGMQDQARFQECKRAVTRCTQAVTKFSRDTKPVLSFTKYYLALGALVEDVLVRLTEDILALPDIPETESHRLHDICKIVHAFESLFLVEGEATSMVTMHVPSWFKYSYLSELLEASLADIRHLFDIGALVDFSEQDLAHLIRALFSDSPKRQELVDRVLAGHPSQT